MPGSTIPSFSNVVSTNLSLYYTNSPLDPVGTPPHLVYATNYTTNVMFVYTRAFANVVTNSFSTQAYVTVIDTSLYYPPLAPIGSPPQTNTTSRTMLTNMVSGDYYLLPSADCGIQILSNVLTTVVGVTNLLVATNAPTTNAGSGTYLLSRAYVNWFTNHSLAYFPVAVQLTNQPGLRRGVEKLTFVKTAYDSLLGKFYAPQTNYFTMTTRHQQHQLGADLPAGRDRPGFPVQRRRSGARPGRRRSMYGLTATRNVNFNIDQRAARTGGAGNHRSRHPDNLQQGGADLLQHHHHQRWLLYGSAQLDASTCNLGLVR